MGGAGRTQTPPVIRAVEPAIITYPAQRSRAKSTGKLPAVPPGEDNASAPQQVKNGNTGKMRAAMAAGAGAVVGAAAFASAQAPAAPSGTPPGGANAGAPGGGIPPRRRSRRWLALLLILLTILLLVGIAFASPGGQQIINNINPSTTTAKVTITPKSQPLANDFYITAVITTPTPGAREVQARIISTTFKNQTGSAGATGSLGGRNATGPLLFINTGGQSVTISGGTLRGNSGVPIAFGGPLTIPIGSITVTGTAVNEGVSGDIPAFDIFGSCCGSSNILVRNTAAFSGGVDPKPNSVITQNDINKAFNNLIAAAQSMAPGKLKGQVKANEEVAPNSLNCKANATPNHKVGDVAPKVTVTGTATCSEEVFDRDGAKMQADAALRMQAASDKNLMGYVPVGIITGITNIVKVKGSTTTLRVTVHAAGVWEYDFTTMIQQELKLAIAGKPESDALNYVKAQPGVLNATIVLSSGSILPMCTTDPANPTDKCKEITIIINPVAGPTGTPTLTPSSPTTTTSPGPPSPTPQNGQGGS